LCRAQLEGETKARGAAQAAAEAASRQVADANNALKQQQSNMQVGLQGWSQGGGGMCVCGTVLYIKP
jgi:hypothetical protein